MLQKGSKLKKTQKPQVNFGAKRVSWEKGGNFKSSKVRKTDLGEGEEESNAAGAGKGHPDLALDPLLAVK